jgi:hypothetical protein
MGQGQVQGHGCHGNGGHLGFLLKYGNAAWDPKIFSTKAFLNVFLADLDTQVALLWDKIDSRPEKYIFIVLGGGTLVEGPNSVSLNPKSAQISPYLWN